MWFISYNQMVVLYIPSCRVITIMPNTLFLWLFSNLYNIVFLTKFTLLFSLIILEDLLFFCPAKLCSAQDDVRPLTQQCACPIAPNIYARVHGRLQKTALRLKISSPVTSSHGFLKTRDSEVSAHLCAVPAWDSEILIAGARRYCQSRQNINSTTVPQPQP